METITQKQELIDWISTIEDVEVLNQLAVIKKKATFNFDEEIKKGLTVEEAKKLSKEKIRVWWGK
jgi:hypothetical protein